MSRGLSQHQRQILGIATHVNRLTQGGTCAVKTGDPLPDYRLSDSIGEIYAARELRLVPQ
jgi:hypothetical protein